ncbi:ABC-three component system middle component 2 [Bradyrhizobium sp. McL0615]|uniref:ABC-three component system middle component 2 n=1 Tax=Bradyrhizobium sp. McL0615 TaxID=3415673 RepID=UPI003CE77EFE
MEALKLDEPASHPFNSPLETGIRALVLLEAFYPRQCDLIEMTWLDHLVVHTADLDGDDVPKSLHPDLPNRAGELLVRRRLLERSLRLMQQMHLVDVSDSEKGICFVASQDAPSFLDLLQSTYTVQLKQRAKWMANRFAHMGGAEIKTLIEAKIGRWTAEFQEEKSSGSSGSL